MAAAPDPREQDEKERYVVRKALKLHRSPSWFNSTPGMS